VRAMYRPQTMSEAESAGRALIYASRRIYKGPGGLPQFQGGRGAHKDRDILRGNRVRRRCSIRNSRESKGCTTRRTYRRRPALWMNGLPATRKRWPRCLLGPGSIYLLLLWYSDFAGTVGCIKDTTHDGASWFRSLATESILSPIATT
jgi:hypothetical protein